MFYRTRYQYGIALEYYNDIYLWVMYGVTLLLILYFVAAQMKPSRVRDNSLPLGPGYMLSIACVVGLVWYFATFPILQDAWSDREGYWYTFMNADSLENDTGDVIWGFITKLVRRFTDDHYIYFGLIALLYVGGRWFASFKFSSQYGYVLFLMMAGGYMFLGYGHNTLRSGVASSLMLLAFATYDNKVRSSQVFAVLLALISVGIHKSMALPAAAFVLAMRYPRPKLYLKVWVVCLFLSAVLADTLSQLLGDFVAEISSSQQAGEYITTNDTESYRRGFRVDFILYSLIPMALGYYYIFKKGYQERLYVALYCAYVLANAFFLLVIRANYVDRFGYLSWFLMPLLLIYPLTRQKMFPHQNRVLSLILLLNAAFNFFMIMRENWGTWRI